MQKKFICLLEILAPKSLAFCWIYSPVGLADLPISFNVWFDSWFIFFIVWFVETSTLFIESFIFSAYANAEIVTVGKKNIVAINIAVTAAAGVDNWINTINQ